MVAVLQKVRMLFVDDQCRLRYGNLTESDHASFHAPVVQVTQKSFPNDAEFLSAIAQAELSEEMIHFVKGTKPSFSDTAVNPFILVRDCYKQLVRSIEDIMKQKNARVAVIGSPGIGKSYFAVYLAIYALDQGYEVLLDMQSLEWSGTIGEGVPLYVYHIYKNSESKNEVRALRRDGITAHMLLFRRECPTFYVGDTIRPPFPHRPGPSVLVSSPKRPHTVYHDFVKAGGEKLYMPPWGWEELQWLNCKMGQPIVDEELYKSFRTIGGEPRSIFSVGRTEFHNSVIEAISTVSVREHIQLVQKESEAESASMSHKILLMEPTDYFRSFRPVFRSDEIGKKAFEKLHQQEQDSIQTFLAAARYMQDMKGFYGQIFEQLCHRKLQNGGEFRIRQCGMTDDDAEKLVLPQASGTLTEIRQPEDISQLHDDYYGWPQVGNFPAVDAIDKGALFQVTVFASHTTKAAPLRKMVTALREKGREAPSRLYFVVPEWLFSSFRRQPYTNSAGNVLQQMPEELGEIEQWALEMPLSVPQQI